MWTMTTRVASCGCSGRAARTAASRSRRLRPRGDPLRNALRSPRLVRRRGGSLRRLTPLGLARRRILLARQVLFRPRGLLFLRPVAGRSARSQLRLLGGVHTRRDVLVSEILEAHDSPRACLAAGALAREGRRSMGDELAGRGGVTAFAPRALLVQPPGREAHGCPSPDQRRIAFESSRSKAPANSRACLGPNPLGPPVATPPSRSSCWKLR